MTQNTPNEEELLEENTTETVKVPPPAKKISKFGNQGGIFGNTGAKFNNPIQKGRPGRAAARGR